MPMLPDKTFDHELASGGVQRCVGASKSRCIVKSGIGNSFGLKRLLSNFPRPNSEEGRTVMAGRVGADPVD